MKSSLANDIVVSLHNPSGATPEITQSGVEVRQGDFTHPTTLDSAFAGGDKLLIVSYPSIAHEIRVTSHISAIDAAKRVGIKHIYYTSLMFADNSQAAVMQAHLDTEKYLKESGLTYTIVREGIYSESYPLYFGYWDPSRGSEVKVPYGDGGIAWVCREDLGEGTARAMVVVRPFLRNTLRHVFCDLTNRQDTYANQTVKFTGSKVWTLSELAGLITAMLKLDPLLKLKIVSLEEYRSINSGGDDLLSKWATTYPALKRGELAVVDPLLKEILGRELKPFEDTLKDMLQVSSDAGASAIRQYSK